MEVKALTTAHAPEIRQLILEIFSGELWNDVWSDEQLCRYVQELLVGSGALAWGLYEAGRLIGISLGRVKHWCAGTEYWIEEFGIHPQRQGCGLGSRFLAQVEALVRERGLSGIVLLTQRTVPAYRFYQRNGFAQQPEQVFFAKELR